MASSAAGFYSTQPSRELCRYFLSSRCRFGDQCRFSHDLPVRLDSNLCRFAQLGTCTYGDRCRFTHVEPAAQATHRHSPTPTNVNRRTVKQDLPASPTEKNQQQQEETRKNASATERSQKKTCGICLEMVWRREVDPRFGLLENCDHVFCLECIRKWRSTSNYENTVVKACPECRTQSDFVTPTKYWPENDQAKAAFIQSYKENLQKIHCKYFQRGDGVCPFGSKCFYRHVDQNGRTVELGPPRRRRRADARQELDHLSDFFIMSLLSAMDVEGLFDELNVFFGNDEDDPSHGAGLTDEDAWTDDDDDDDDDDEEFEPWLWN